MTPTMPRKEKITFNLPPDIRALGEVFAGQRNKSLSVWIEGLMTRDMLKHGVDPDLPPPELQRAVEKWVADKAAKKAARESRPKKPAEGGRK